MKITAAALALLAVGAFALPAAAECSWGHKNTVAEAPQTSSPTDVQTATVPSGD